MKSAATLIAARASAPEHLRGPDLDAWLLSAAVDCLEPMQRDVLLWLIASDTGMDTAELCTAAHALANRIGSACSALRAMGLITTEMRTDRPGQYAHHTAVGWVRQAWARYCEWLKENEVVG